MRYSNLQIVRLFAALGVVIYHLGVFARLPQIYGNESAFSRTFQNGFCGALGVNTFFVISGFVLTHSLRGGSVRRFLGLRLLRLYPAYWLALALVLPVHYAVWLGDPQFGPGWRTGLALLPGGHSSGYFLGVEWTLVYEIFFSLVVAALAWVGGRRAVVIGAFVWLGLCVGRLATHDPDSALWAFPTWGQIAFSTYNIPFLLGVFVWTVRDWSFRWFGVPAAILGLAVLVEGFGYSRSSAVGTNLCLSVAGAAIVWLAIRLPQVRLTWLIRGGDWSYGIYLLHVPVVLVVFRLLRERAEVGGASWGVVLAGTTAVLVGCAFGRLELGMYARLKARLFPAGVPKAVEAAAPVDVAGEPRRPRDGRDAVEIRVRHWTKTPSAI